MLWWDMQAWCSSDRFGDGLIKEYATSYDVSISYEIHKTIMDIIEDSIDAAILEAAMERISKDGTKMYTFEEAGKELGFL